MDMTPNPQPDETTADSCGISESDCDAHQSEEKPFDETFAAPGATSMSGAQPVVESAPASIPRRHDLDALRAIAMLLGILLHGAIAYIPMTGDGWPVHDSANSSAFGVLLAFLHGFRLPLFFLISGFFTAMLWRKRGLRALVRHRYKRIFLPLAIGLFTIVPATWVASIATGIRSAQLSESQPATLFSAIRQADAEAIDFLLVPGDSLNELEPESGSTALTIAAGRGDEDLVLRLIDSGADVNARNRDGSTALHSAVLLANEPVVGILFQHGADTTIKNRLGETPAAMLSDYGVRVLITGGMLGKQIESPPDRSGITPLFQEQGSDVTPISKDEAVGKFLVGVGVLLLTIFPIFHHLWFLWFLCWLVAAFVIYVKVASFIKVRLPDWAVLSPLRYAWLIPLTMIPQMFMGHMYPVYGPDTSTGIIPMPHILAYYAVFFFFGALYFDRDDSHGRLGRGWKLTLPIAALIVFPIGLELTTGEWGIGGFAIVDSGWNHLLAGLLQVTYAWMMTFGLMGMFRSLLSGESRTMRYVSDSAYWLYVAHLPLIMVAQSVVQDWPLPAMVKLILVTFATSGLLLLSYHWCVRYTVIGRLLNGPRVRPVRPA